MASRSVALLTPRSSTAFVARLLNTSPPADSAAPAQTTKSTETTTAASAPPPVEKEQKKDHARTFYRSEMVTIPALPSEKIPKPTGELPFGKYYSDHMIDVDWTLEGGWGKPKLHKLQPLQLHPGSKVLHYAIELFEGMKAYRGIDNKIRMFRPDMNMARMNRTAQRSALPTFDSDELINMIADQIRLDLEWVPSSATSSLYIRPTLIGTDKTLGVGNPHDAKLFVVTCPVGSYFTSGFQPVSLLADSQFVRAFPGGVGAFKMGCNYAPTIDVTDGAAQYGAQQCLWLWGDKQRITETGTSNLFLFWKNSNDDVELITPPTSGGLILPGVTRESILTLAKEWGEFLVTERYPTMKEVKEAAAEGRILEFFGAGTAAVVAPCEQIVYVENPNEPPVLIDIPERKDGKPLYRRLYETITGIQNGKIDRPEWVRIVN